MADRPRLPVRHALALFAVVALVAAACTDGVTPRAAPETTQSTPSTTAATSATPTPTPIATTTTTQPPTTTTTTLPGAPYNGPGPQAGDLVAVVGVAHDDVLNVREGPGIRYTITDTLEPTALDIPVTGAARLLPTSIWYEVEQVGGTGWVSHAFIGLLGVTDDATAEVHAMLGSPLADDDLAALGATIAFAFLSDEGGGWTALVEPSEGGSPTAVSSITYDVIGLGDDAVKGYRLVIHATQAVEDGPYTLHSVERTSICWRGVDTDGLCV